MRNSLETLQAMPEIAGAEVITTSRPFSKRSEDLVISVKHAADDPLSYERALQAVHPAALAVVRDQKLTGYSAIPAD